MNLQLIPIDGSHFLTSYFWVSTAIALIMALASVWNEIKGDY